MGRRKWVPSTALAWERCFLFCKAAETAAETAEPSTPVSAACRPTNQPAHPLPPCPLCHMGLYMVSPCSYPKSTVVSFKNLRNTGIWSKCSKKCPPVPYKRVHNRRFGIVTAIIYVRRSIVESCRQEEKLSLGMTVELSLELRLR